MAIGKRRPDGVVHHSDKGTQYTSLAFGKRCREMRVVTSTGSAGDCFDNAMAESFFATLECELIDRRRFQTHAEARMAIFECVEAWYNRKRRHSALGYLSPEKFERAAAKGASRPAATTNHHDQTTGLGAFRIDDLEVHSGLQEASDPSDLGKTSPPPAIAHLRTGDESRNLSTEAELCGAPHRRGNSTARPCWACLGRNSNHLPRFARPLKHRINSVSRCTVVDGFPRGSPSSCLRFTD